MGLTQTARQRFETAGHANHVELTQSRGTPGVVVRIFTFMGVGGNRELLLPGDHFYDEQASSPQGDAEQL